MRKLILIRHGETNYTALGKYCGHKDIPLNKKGMVQADRIWLKLKKTKVDKVYSSDLKRTLQTAKIVFKDKEIFKKKDLREIDFGRFCGLTIKETFRLYPKIYKVWLNKPLDVKMPEGESVADFTKRVLRCFRSISNQNLKKTVAIVSHGGPIRIILLNLLKLGIDRFWDIEQDVAAVNIIEFQNRVPKILKINN